MFNIVRYFRKNKKIGLALGSGSARGLAHIGVLKAIKDMDIKVDYMAGTSIGALIGACYAIKEDISDIEEIILNTDFKRMLGLIDLNVIFTHKGVIRGDKVKELLKTIMGDIEFKDLKVPFAVVATDVHSGDEIIINEGSVVEAVRASISIPVAFVPVKRKDRFLMDGGLVNPIPVNVVRDMGADFIIASNVSKSSQLKNHNNMSNNTRKIVDFKKYKASIKKTTVYKEFNKKLNTFFEENNNVRLKQQQLLDWISQLAVKGAELLDKDTPDVFYTLGQALFSMEARLVETYLKDADLIIQPDTGDVDTYDFHKGVEAIEKGYTSASLALTKIHKN